MREKEKIMSLAEEFRHARGQYSEVSDESLKPKKKKTDTYYENTFLNKYENVEKLADKFSSKDLVFYFREVAKETGFKYYIHSLQKDMSVFKKLKKDYSSPEICAMIEFLFKSDQNYLSKNRVSPSILTSTWNITIFADTLLWIDDKYYPKDKAIKKNKPKGEWKLQPQEEEIESSIGEW